MPPPAKDRSIGFNSQSFARTPKGPWRTILAFCYPVFRERETLLCLAVLRFLSEGSDSLYILSLLSNSFFQTRLASRFFRGAPSRREAQPTLLPLGVNDFFSGWKKVPTKVG